MTAGHCGSGTLSINGNASTAILGISVTGYRDREAVVAGGSSKYVQVTPGGTSGVDMENIEGHIYIGNWVSHFGQGSDQNDGGVINAVNIPNEDGVLTSRNADANCEYGDSGGPAYYYRPSDGKRFPKGLINSAVNGNGLCHYVALDDQFAGVSWTLK